MDTLKRIKRDNISIEDYQDLQKRFTKDGITTYTEFILALPGDTYKGFSDGVSQVIESGQHNRIQYNNLSILPNAEMSFPENMKKDKITTVEGPIVNMHGSLDETPLDGIVEKQLLVTSTRTLSFDDWKKTRVYASVSELIYFNKLFQIPLLILNKLENINFKTLFEYFMNTSNNFPIINRIVKNFYFHAEQIANGKSEFCYKEGLLDIYWPPGEFEYINLVKNNKIDAFYREFEENYKLLCKSKLSASIFSDSIELNKKMMRLPDGSINDFFVDKYNIYNSYQSIIKMEDHAFKKSKEINLEIIRDDMKFNSFEEWLREVIWYGHRSGKYLYTVIENNKSDKPEKNDMSRRHVS